MIRKVIFGIMFYLSVMLAISGISFIFSESSNGEKAEAVVIESNSTISINEIQKISIYQIEPHDLMTVVEKVTTTFPFGFTIKIIEENEEKQALLHSYSFIGNLTNYNYVEEIEKRKIKTWYKRKFALYIIKNRIKILKSKKWKLNILFNNKK